MEHSEETHRKAFEFYFQTELTQQEIADILNVNRKTLYTWIKDGAWKRAKYAAAHAPGVLLEQYYGQLGAINMCIAQRADRPYPTKDEADIIRKLTMTIKGIGSGTRTVGENVQVFQAFTDKLRRKSPELTKQILPHMTEHINSLSSEGQWLRYSQLQKEEENFDKEYGEWLAKHTAPQPAPETPSPATSLPLTTPALPAQPDAPSFPLPTPSLPAQPTSPSLPLSAPVLPAQPDSALPAQPDSTALSLSAPRTEFGVSNGALTTPPTPSKPATGNHISDNKNVDLSTEKNIMSNGASPQNANGNNPPLPPLPPDDNAPDTSDTNGSADPENPAGIG